MFRINDLEKLGSAADKRRKAGSDARNAAIRVLFPVVARQAFDKLSARL
jgi:hypothetical protein